MMNLKVGEKVVATELWAFNPKTKEPRVIEVKFGVGFTREPNPKYKNPLYIENGLLEEVNTISVYRVGMYDYTDEFIGFYKVKPEWFDVTLCETFDKTLTYYEYELNEVGYENLVKNGLNEERTSIKCVLVTRDEIQDRIDEVEKLVLMVTQSRDFIKNSYEIIGNIE